MPSKGTTIRIVIDPFAIVHLGDEAECRLRGSPTRSVARKQSIGTAARHAVLHRGDPGLDLRGEGALAAVQLLRTAGAPRPSTLLCQVPPLLATVPRLAYWKCI